VLWKREADFNRIEQHFMMSNDTYC